MTGDHHRGRETARPTATAWSRRRFCATGAAALTAILAGCGADSAETSFDGRVLVVGAGPAGLTAAHLLRRAGVEVEVLEAGPTHGGRIRHDLDVADFPIPLGAEWVHVDGSILDEIVDDPSVDVGIDLVGYGPDDEVAIVGPGGDVVAVLPIEPEVFDGDTKFRGSSWLDFYDTNVVPGIADVIRYDTPIVEIDHGGDRVVATDAAGGTHTADRIIVTVPLRILQRRELAFVPPLEPERLAVIDEATVWSGFKAFIEFEEAFYPAAVAFPDSETADGQRLFYDAAHGQDSDRHILGLFSVGAQAEAYQAANRASPDEFIAGVLAELDAAFEGAASAGYVRHRVQDWNAEPFARAAYLEDDADPRISRQLARPLGDLVFFAGDAYTSFDDWSSVHTAARSAADAVEQLLG